MGRTVCFFGIILSFPFATATALASESEAAPIGADGFDTPAVAPDDWDETTKLWIARSCAGEAGFFAVDECIAIAWVYKTRAQAARSPLLDMVRRYSAAVKRHSTHQRPWLLELNLDGEKPKSWPKRLKWSRYRQAWAKLLDTLDRWAAGEFENPVPNADHFGSRQDAERAYFQLRWKRLDAPDHFRNWFFDSTSRVGRLELKRVLKRRAWLSGLRKK